MMFYHVFCINRKETANTFLKKTMYFFSQPLLSQLLISNLNFTLLIMLLSLFPLTKNVSCICTHEKLYLPAESLNGSESTCLTPFCLSLLFHNNNSITQSELQFALRLFHSYISLQVA